MPLATEKKGFSLKDLNEAITKLKNESKKNFTQTFDLIIHIEGLDLKKEGGKLNKIIMLPNKPNKEKKVCVIGELTMAEKAKEGGADLILRKSDIEKLQGNKRELKKIARKYDFFLVQPDLMPLVGKLLGPYLGARGKLPEIVSPNVDVKSTISRLKQSVRIKVKNQPVISCGIGTEDMSTEKLSENALTVINEVEKLIEGKGRIKSIYLKKTMSYPIKLR
jgi:large subunit ribosomal protein L1